MFFIVNELCIQSLHSKLNTNIVDNEGNIHTVDLLKVNKQRLILRISIIFTKRKNLVAFIKRKEKWACNKL